MFCKVECASSKKRVLNMIKFAFNVQNSFTLKMEYATRQSIASSNIKNLVFAVIQGIG